MKSLSHNTDCKTSVPFRHRKEQKRGIAKNLLLLVLLMFSSVSYAQFEHSVTEVAKLMGVGWNLGNTMEAGNNAYNFTNRGGLGAETSWQDTKTTQAVIDYVKAQGFRSIRIPCAWVMGHISNATNYTIDAAWMRRVKEVVDYCIKADLYVVINQHWDGGWLENHIDASGADIEKNTTILTTIWQQIATTFRDYDEHLLFAGLNEPAADNKLKTKKLLDYEQAFVNAVRGTGGNNEQRILVLQGPTTNIDYTYKYYDDLPTDPTGKNRYMVEIHYYAPWQFWGMEKDENWGKVFYYWGEGNHQPGSSHNPTYDCEESYMRSQLEMMKTKFVDKGIPVIIGEFGANWRDISNQAGESQEKHNASIKLHYKTLCQYALEMGLVPMMWDTNYRQPSMTIIDRKNLRIYNPYMMEGIKEAMETSSIRSTSMDTPSSSSLFYDLTGRPLANIDTAHKGIYIKDGRKFFK